MKNHDNKESESYCARCETIGVKKLADTFIFLDDIGAKERTPLCRQCKKEWVEELFTEDDGQ